jgi:hypothetical protein
MPAAEGFHLPLLVAARYCCHEQGNLPQFDVVSRKSVLFSACEIITLSVAPMRYGINFECVALPRTKLQLGVSLPQHPRKIRHKFSSGVIAPHHDRSQAIPSFYVNGFRLDFCVGIHYCRCLQDNAGGAGQEWRSLPTSPGAKGLANRRE